MLLCWLMVSEIDAQVSNGNQMLGGTDQLGSHAMAYIENDELREELKFDLQRRKRGHRNS